MGWNLKLADGTPRKFAILLYTQWEALDIMGPIEALNTLSRNVVDQPDQTMTLNIITARGQPASTAPRLGPGSLVNQQMIATHGFWYDPANPTADLLENIPAADVLIIPGGLGPPDDEQPGLVAFIKQYYAKYLKDQSSRYLITVCTGSGLAAEAGCLDLKYATTNKTAYNYISSAAANQKCYWVAQARWVQDGNIWTTAGVSAGTDGFLAWMASVYGESIEEKVRNGMEYHRPSEKTDDEFSKDLVDHPGKSGLPKYNK